MKTVGILCFFLMVFGMFGCRSREHLRADFAKSNRENFSRQRIHKEAAKESPIGLDSEEAAIVHKTYRKQIGGESAAEPKDSPTRVLLLQEPADAKK
ncbi:MAG: hypothetical protein V1754_05380 [Pseudomonadota bacterium]